MKKDFWAKLEKRLRDFFARQGFTCDLCGAEIFDYPQHRLCADCAEKLCRSGEKVCSKCGRKAVVDGVCSDCKSNLPKFTRGFTPFVYEGQTAAMINRMKNGNPRLALYLGEEMAEYFAEKYFQNEPQNETQSEFQNETQNDNKNEEFLVVPVPMTKSKIAERGYNQAERLAESVCERLRALGYSVRLETDLLQKRKETAPQKQMTYHERLENVAGAYHVHERKACRDKKIILVDDVMTTGATASECALRLFGAGAKEVYFLVSAALIERK